MNTQIFTKCLSLVLLFISSLAFSQFNCVPGNLTNGNADPWSNECYYNDNCEIQGNPCTANDVNVVDAYFADATGTRITSCNTGDMSQVWIYASFSNTTGTDRYAIRAYADVLINGVFVSSFNVCAFDQLASGMTMDTSVLGSVNFTCGDVVTFENIWIAWSPSSGDICANSTSCGDYPSSKCYNTTPGTGTELRSDFSAICTTNLYEFQFVENPIGGSPDYTYSWDFGDGNISTDSRPTHIYTPPTSTTQYLVSLKVTDADGNSHIYQKWVTPETCTINPIQILTFSGAFINEKQIELNWVTATEHNNEKFVVERRGIFDHEFMPIGELAGAGDSQDLLEYKFIDTPISQATYYRLKQVDFDGNYEYTSIIKLEREISEPILEVITGQNEFVLNFSSREAVSVKSIQVSNAQGRIVDFFLPGKLSAMNSQYFQFYIPNGSYGRDLYFITVEFGDGSRKTIKAIRM